MKHGELHAYDHLGCRCAECSDAARTYRRRLWERNGRQHGLAGSFAGCRCEVCKSAGRDYSSKRTKRANSKSLAVATKSRQRWTLADVQIATERRPDGSYVRRVSEVGAMLGRSNHAVMRMRQRCLSEHVGSLV